MTHKVEMRKDGLLHLTIYGVVTEDDADEFISELMRHLELADETPVNLLVDTKNQLKASSGARKKLTQLNTDERFGRVAVFNVDPFVRVLALFAMQISGRSNIHLFATEAEALAWLNGSKESLFHL